ncbi:hypothetical protein PY254_06215 [Rhodanobacter sp. AS-Z3]|uniref:hypothetical protein n=1 Tax=Rhodanobacter sp. AS-Z3 TaxID=3031330 RepID=UPI0024790FD9|nr:hypothetical protein [Rhodanobacter sp. AS-Z3]WEN16259.1 hypothetical protein PY254_06215 [Rhodanobacter sp. AS-Z3]
MSPLAQSSFDAGHRDRVLRALGVTPWIRRGLPVAAVQCNESGAGVDATTDAAGPVACVVVLPDGCTTRELDLVSRALMGCGAVLARAARVVVREGQLAVAPEAQAYLVFGEAQAHALGRALPAAVMHRAQIVLVDEPAQVLIHAEAKRRLWNALRSVRRTLALAGD